MATSITWVEAKKIYSKFELAYFDHVVSLALTYVLVDFLTLEFYREAGKTYIVSVSQSAQNKEKVSKLHI